MDVGDALGWAIADFWALGGNPAGYPNRGTDCGTGNCC